MMYSALLTIIGMIAMAIRAEDGELNLGRHYYEGDIRLTQKQEAWLEKSSDGSHVRALTSDQDRLWPNGEVPYVIDPSLRDESKQFIQQAAQHWNSRTDHCIKIIPKQPSHQNYVEFVYDGGCSSNLGMLGTGRQTISVGDGLTVICGLGNIIHEIAHVIGFFHEHSRPDRDTYIRVTWDSIKPGYEKNFYKMPPATINSHGVGYDYGSVTHYGEKFFTKTGEPTIVPLQPVPTDVTIGQRVGLSNMDIQQAKLLYGCPASVTKSTVEVPLTDKGEERKMAIRRYSKSDDKSRAKTHASKVRDSNIEGEQDEASTRNDQSSTKSKSKGIEDKTAKKRRKAIGQEDKVVVSEQNNKSFELNGELNLGHHYFEGDVLLTPNQSEMLKKARMKDGLHSRGLTNDISKLWPNGVVPYVFGLGLRPRIKGIILSAIKEWNTKTKCINIRPKSAQDFHYIEFAYQGGCSSYIGMVGNRQFLSVGGPKIQCQYGNIVHELGHALGFYHEQSRPDRDQHVKIIWDNIKDGYKVNFEGETTSTIDSRGIKYDFDSIMHYGDKFFSKKPWLKTIETKPKPGKPIGQRRGLSDLDIKQANLLYNKCNGVRKNTVTIPPDIVIATKAASTISTPARKSRILNLAVKKFVKNVSSKSGQGKIISGTISKHSEIFDTESDPMIDADDTGVATMDPKKSNALSSKEKKLFQQITNNKAADIEQISGEENIGKHYFEGDMMLSNEQKQWFDSAMVGSNPAKKRALIKNPTYLWKSHTVPYVFHKSVDKIGVRFAKLAMKHWKYHTCLRFPKRKNEKDYIMFVFEGGCSSRVGRVGGMQKINIGAVNRYCKRGNVIHEIGHALGFFHEQSRTDRDQYVRIIKKNVIGWYRNNFLKFDESFVDERGVPYDYNSVMHYGRSFFSRNHFFYPTIVPLFKTIHDRPVKIGQRYGLSDMDILQANLLYNCKGEKRLTEEKSNKLYEKTQGVIEIEKDNQALGSCQDRYDDKACLKIKSFGYCERFPRTLRHACGQTCQLCGTTPPNTL